MLKPTVLIYSKVQISILSTILSTSAYIDAFIDERNSYENAFQKDYAENCKNQRYKVILNIVQ